MLDPVRDETVMLRNERTLWQSVILRAFLDASFGAENAKSYRDSFVYKVQCDARAWLQRGSRDLYDVCDLADVNAEVVLQTARRVEKKGWSRNAIFAEAGNLNIDAKLLRQFEGGKES